MVKKKDKYQSRYGALAVLGTIFAIANTILWYVNASLRDAIYANALGIEILALFAGLYLLTAEENIYT